MDLRFSTFGLGFPNSGINCKSNDLALLTQGFVKRSHRSLSCQRPTIWRCSFYLWTRLMLTSTSVWRNLVELVWWPQIWCHTLKEACLKLGWIVSHRFLCFPGSRCSDWESQCRLDMTRCLGSWDLPVSQIHLGLGWQSGKMKEMLVQKGWMSLEGPPSGCKFEVEQGSLSEIIELSDSDSLWS